MGWRWSDCIHEACHRLLHVGELFVGQSVMAGKDQAASHHLLGVPVGVAAEMVSDPLERRLLQDIAGEDRAGLDASLLQVSSKLSSGEGCCVTDGQRECEPIRFGVRCLFRQNEEFFVLREECAEFRKALFPQPSEPGETVELLQGEGCGYFERQEVVPDLTEDELVVVGNAFEFDVEAVIQLFGPLLLAKKRRVTAPAAQDHQALSSPVVVCHDHAATPCTIDDV